MKASRRRPGMIRCVSCRQETEPSRRDSIYCKACSDKLYARLDAATGEDIDGAALLEGIFRNNQQPNPVEEAAGDGERAYAHERFEVRRHA